MVIMVFDTETISIDKPFCYNIGYTIVNTDSREILEKREFIIEQIWHNLVLFSTAYYAEKRSLYIPLMRCRKIIMDKWGYVMRAMAKDIREYCVECAYAYNSPFDDKVFTFNCDWFKTLNPFDTLPIYDIRGMASETLFIREDYKAFCEEHKRFTDTGNYSATAETVYQYITQNPEFIESHTALSDSEIETEILFACMEHGALIGIDYGVTRILEREKKNPFTVSVDGTIVYEGTYAKKRVFHDHYIFKTKL